MCFENVFEIDAFVAATNVIDSCLSVLQKCVSFRKDVSNVFESLFWKCLWSMIFEKEASVFASWSQVTKSLSTPIILKGFLYVFNPFLTILFHHWIWWTILRLGCLTGRARVIVWTMNAMVPSVFGNLLWRDYDHSILGNFRKRHRGTYDHLNLFCQRNSTCKHGPFWKATCGITLGGASVIVYWFHVFVLY